MAFAVGKEIFIAVRDEQRIFKLQQLALVLEGHFIRVFTLNIHREKFDISWILFVFYAPSRSIIYSHVSECMNF